jgi:hypothetical protein
MANKACVGSVTLKWWIKKRVENISNQFKINDYDRLLQSKKVDFGTIKRNGSWILNFKVQLEYLK